MDVSVGDRVQIRDGGIDVTNGNKARSGRYYGEGGPLWATVDAIVEDWYTGGLFGLPTRVTKVRCSNSGVVVWQVQPEDIVGQVIKASEPEIVQRTFPERTYRILPTFEGYEDLTVRTSVSSSDINVNHNEKPYVMTSDQYDWGNGVSPETIITGEFPETFKPSTKLINDRSFTTQGNYSYENRGTRTLRKLNSKEKASIGTNNIKIDDTIKPLKQQTAWQNSSKKRQMLNNDIENIQNNHSFPALSKPSSGLLSSKYDYQIILDDYRYKKNSTKSLEDSLMEARASLGIPVHGSNNIAKAMKYYMYNRFKVPDTNLAHNKSVTYVFFTRPDLNILTKEEGKNTYVATNQVINHSESSLIWKRNPELFKLLTDYRRCDDENNFNMLLSNQVQSFDIKDEEISTVKDGSSWNEYEMVYGDAYTGRAAGTFSCDFVETSDYSIINLIKLWITYIDNVARGAWSPSYKLKDLADNKPNLGMSHVFTKTLDYASSAYVFKCGPDGETVLYWSKYYGVFPTNTGASALRWDISTPIGDVPRLNITFNYSFKKDLSPISLLEFNHIANITDKDVISEDSFNPKYGHSSRPYVGAPFIQMKLNQNPTVSGNGVDYNRNESYIKLKFRNTGDSRLEDRILYRASLDRL